MERQGHLFFDKGSKLTSVKLCEKVQRGVVHGWELREVMITGMGIDTESTEAVMNAGASGRRY